MSRITIEPTTLRFANGTSYKSPLPHKKARQAIRRGNAKDDRPAVTLYHYTRPESVESILREGITRGDTPTSVIVTPDQPYGAGCNAIWLSTVDRIGESHGWTNGCPDKTTARFTVEIPKMDNRLWLWSRFARVAKIDAETIDHLNKVAPNGEHSQWYVYFGTIPTDWIKTQQPKDGLDAFLDIVGTEVPETCNCYECRPTHFQCPICGYVHDGMDLVIILECSPCERTWSLDNEGPKCPDCNKGYSRTLHDRGCYLCQDEQPCQEAATQ